MCAFFLKRLIAVRLIRLILISLRSNDFFAVFCALCLFGDFLVILGRLGTFVAPPTSVPSPPIPLRPFGRDLIPTSHIGVR